MGTKIQMNQNQPQLQPHEQPISFDELEKVEPVEMEMPVPSKGSLKDKVLAEIKKEKAESISTPFSEPAITYPDTQPIPPALPPIPVETKQPTKQEVTETTVEAPAEQPAELPAPKKASVTTDDATPASTATALPATDKTEVRKQIESILQQGLSEMFVNMPPAERAAFSKSANETAGKLELLVSQFKATAREVLALIRAWLTKIPKVNKYFLEQSSKIKTDEILEVQRQARKRSRLIH